MCPPGVDQTMRSSQCWLLVAPFVQQSCSLTATGETSGYMWHNESIPEGSIFNPKNAFGAWAKLARPVLPSQSSLPSMSPSAKTADEGKVEEQSGIEGLPIELVLMILEGGALSKNDIIALGLACPSFLPIIISHIHSFIVSSVAPWAGTPIACLGNYTLDLPASFMEYEDVTERFARWDEETRALMPPPGPVGPGNSTGSGRGRLGMGRAWRRGLPPARSWYWECASFGDPKNLKKEEQAWRDALKEWDLEGILSGRMRSLIDVIGEQLACPDLFPAGKEWVLRNLTTKEYYIPQPFPDVERKILQPPYDSRLEKSSVVDAPAILGFDDVMMLRACYTSIPSERYRKIQQGSWAGHCFDIVTREVFAVEGMNEWRDAGQELLGEAKNMWDGMTGIGEVEDNDGW